MQTLQLQHFLRPLLILTAQLGVVSILGMKLFCRLSQLFLEVCCFDRLRFECLDLFTQLIQLGIRSIQFVAQLLKCLFFLVALNRKPMDLTLEAVLFLREFTRAVLCNLLSYGGVVFELSTKLVKSRDGVVFLPWASAEVPAAAS